MLKKIVAAFVLSAMLLTQLFCASAANVSNPDQEFFPKIVVGDVNGDGVIDSLDYALIKAYLLKIITSLPNPEGLRIGDLNGDGALDALDLNLMRQFLLKRITKF
ncbi:MAG TPA: dockerin type I repeat-containing protein [Clostridia bacterium]|nr:dockerin type I repeat-containing protein [Clostridia bacterium]